MSETLFRVTTPTACFGFVVNDQTLRVVDCAPIGRRALMGTTFGGAVVYCHGRRWRVETVRVTARTARGLAQPGPRRGEGV